MNGSRIFLHAYSFEERSLAAVGRAAQSLPYDKVISVDYENVPSDLRVAYDANRARARGHIDTLQVDHREVCGTTYSQFNLPDAIAKVVGDGRVEIDFDISCFTKLHILSLLRSLYGRVKWVYYIGAETHYVSPKDRVRIGHRECVGVIGYEGFHRVGGPSLLVVILGFEGDRSLASYLELDPSMAVGVIGCPWIEPRKAIKYVDGALRNNGLLLKHHNVFTELAPSLSASGFASRLRDIVSEYKVRANDYFGEEVNVTVVPLGTKIQCLGLYFLWTRYPEVQVMYPMPYEYQLVARGVGGTISVNLREFNTEKGIDIMVEDRFRALAQGQSPAPVRIDAA